MMNKVTEFLSKNVIFLIGLTVPVLIYLKLGSQELFDLGDIVIIAFAIFIQIFSVLGILAPRSLDLTDAEMNLVHEVKKDGNLMQVLVVGRTFTEVFKVANIQPQDLQIRIHDKSDSARPPIIADFMSESEMKKELQP